MTMDLFPFYVDLFCLSSATRLVTDLTIRVTPRVSYKRQELLSFRDHMAPLPCFLVEVRVVHRFSFLWCVVFFVNVLLVGGIISILSICFCHFTHISWKYYPVSQCGESQIQKYRDLFHKHLHLERISLSWYDIPELNFLIRILLLTRKLLSQGFIVVKLKSSIRLF
jgi:hypothetical protein